MTQVQNFRIRVFALKSNLPLDRSIALKNLQRLATTTTPVSQCCKEILKFMSGKFAPESFHKDKETY